MPTLLTTYQMLTSGTLGSFSAVSSSFVSLLKEQSAVLSKQLEAGGSNWYGNTSVGIFQFFIFAYAAVICMFHFHNESSGSPQN